MGTSFPCWSNLRLASKSWELAFDNGAQSLQGVVFPLPRRTPPDSESFSHVRFTHAHEVPERQHDPVLRLQIVYSPPQLPVLGPDVDDRLHCRLGLIASSLALPESEPVSFGPPDHQRLTDDDAQEPWRKRAALLKTVKVGQGFDECVLGCVLGVRLVTEDVESKPIGSVGVSVEQLCQRRTIIRLGPADQLRF